MRRTSGALVCACAVLFTIGLSATTDRQKAGKRRAPQNAPVTGQAVERGGGQSSAHGNGGGGNGRAVERDRGRADERVDRRDAWMDRDHCRVVVTEYYDRRGLPPGLAKKRSLPPGLQKQLRERGHLPPGLEKHWVVLPVELERTLPPLPPHYVRRAVGNDLLVIDIHANLVVSIMAGVFIRR
jgi:hypothetical protein